MPLLLKNMDVKNESAHAGPKNSRKWDGLRTFLIQEGKYEEVSTVNFNMFKFALSKSWQGEFAQRVKIFLTENVTKVVKLIKK